MNVVLLTISPEAVRLFHDAARTLDDEHPGWGTLHLEQVSRPPRDEDLRALPALVAGADAVICDLMGADPRWLTPLEEALDGFEGAFIPCGVVFRERARLGQHRAQDGPDGSRMEAIMAAFRQMRPADAQFILTLLLHHYGGRPDVAVTTPSEVRRGVHLARPGVAESHATVDEFVAAAGGPQGRPVVALIYYAGGFPLDGTPASAALYRALGEVCWVLPVSIDTDAVSALVRLREIFATPGRAPELVVSMMGFRLGAGPTGGDAEAGVQLLRDIDVPLVKPLVLSRQSVEEWQASRSGLTPSETLVSLLLPELDGCLDEITVGAMSRTVDPRDGMEVESVEPIPRQIERLVQRVQGLLRLRGLRNQDKRVAIIGYDYPAGEGAMLGGAFLDVAASIERIMAWMADEGYRLTPPSPGGLLPDLLSRAVNSPSYATAHEPTIYPRAQAHADLPRPEVWSEVENRWPADTDLPMIDPSGDYQIPVVDYGNVLVGVQPGRGPLGGAQLSHDNAVPPHPQYVAFYTWLRRVWKADVIVHVGTHGTFEFLKAKENAVSVDCYPDLMLESTPHVYLYYCANPTEALIARRRSHACIVSYQPPVMGPGGLHDELAELGSLLTEYRRCEQLAPQTADEMLETLQAQAERCHLPTDVAQLEVELERLADGLVPWGLHVFGQHWTAEERDEMVCAVLGNGQADLPPAAELLARSRQMSVEQFDALPASGRAELDRQAREIILTHLHRADGHAVAPVADDDPLALLRGRADRLVELFGQNREWHGLGQALSGRYVEARLGGDVVRTPDVMPTGASLFQFDPRRVPSPLAMQRGRVLAEQLRQACAAQQDGRVPRCVAIVLWGIETSRTQGETYAQILSLLGVRMVERPHPGRPRWQIILADELPAPRVDVVVTISGFFRDLFGTLIDELDDVVHAVAALDEPAEINPIAERVRQLRRRLRDRGLDDQEAADFSTARVFGPAPGLYGTGLDAVVDASAWGTTQDLADHFINAAQHVHARGARGRRVPGLYEEQLADVEVVSQIRSANEYQITDLDHFFEFLGGVATAASSIQQHPVAALMPDTTGRRVFTQTAGEATRAGLYTRLLNPQWIESMLAHGHRGVAEIATRTTNLVGLSATTGEVDGWMFDAVFDKFIADEQMRERLSQLNPHATVDLAARLTEAHRRQMWQATDEQQDLLDDVQFDLDSALEGESGDDAATQA